MHQKTDPPGEIPPNPFALLARPPHPAEGGPSLGARLKAWRLGNGLTQLQAAHLIDVPLSSYVQTEHGESEPGAFGRRFLEILLVEWEKGQPAKKGVARRSKE